MSLPSTIAAGETLSFTESLSGYPASAYTLAFVLNKEGTLIANIAATASGDTFIILVAAATTAAYTPGRVSWVYVVTKIADNTKSRVCSGFITITPNPEVTLAPSPTQQQLSALDATLLLLTQNPDKMVSFNGQNFTKEDMLSLMKVRDQLQTRVWAELTELGISQKGGVKTIATRFCS